MSPCFVTMSLEKTQICWTCKEFHKIRHSSDGLCGRGNKLVRHGYCCNHWRSGLAGRSIPKDEDSMLD